MCAVEMKRHPNQQPRSCPPGEIWPGPGYDGCVPLNQIGSPLIKAQQIKGRYEANRAIAAEAARRIKS